jgi:hypothetical protein
MIDVSFRQWADAVYPDTASRGAPLARHDDVNGGRRAIREQGPEQGGASVADDRAVATCKHRRHLPSPRSHRRVAHEVDATVHAMQPAAGSPSVNRRVREAELTELRPRDGTMLPSRQHRNLPIQPARSTAAEFSSHSDDKPAPNDIAPCRHR